MKMTKEIRAEQKKNIEAWLKEGQEIYTLPVHSTQTPTRYIKVFIIDNGQIRDISFAVAGAGGYSFDESRHAVKVSGGGFDAGLDIVLSLKVPKLQHRRI